jgi:hypothetical protein
VRHRPVPVHRDRRDGQAPSPGGFEAGQDDFVVIPHTTYQKITGIRANVVARGVMRRRRSLLCPSKAWPREQAMREVEETMRIRHGLRLDEPNDFDIVTQDANPRVLRSDHAGCVSWRCGAVRPSR